MKWASLDPAKRRCGVAMWKDSRLFWAATIKARTPEAMWRQVAAEILTRGAEALVFEAPQDYFAKNNRREDLFYLRKAIENIALIAQIPYRMHTAIKPHAWKGTITKGVAKRRIMRILTASERGAFEDDIEDTWDAAGVGLFHINRAKMGMIPVKKEQK